MTIAAKPYDTLPKPAQRDTKRKRATMQKFNAAIEELLKARGAVLVRDWPDSPDSLVGHAMRWWNVETPAGTLVVMPSGHSVMCRFEEPERANAFLGCWRSSLNTYSGKWNHHYFGRPLDAAITAFADALAYVTRTDSPYGKTAG